MEELKLNCIHEMYTSTILNQQIKYSILEEKYNSLLGNNYITEEADQKKQSIFKKAIETIKRWIGKIITFITKTIPNWIKKQAEKIANLFKKRKNAKVIDVSKLPKTHQEEVKKLANSANAVTKSSRKVEEIKAELVNSEDSDSYLVNNLRQMNAEMQHQTNAAFDDLNNTKYDTAMNITNRHAELNKLLKETEERNKIREQELEKNMKDIDEALERISDHLGDDKDDKTMKKQDQIAEELDSILDDIKDAVNKKEDVVVVDTPTPKLKGYKGMYIPNLTIQQMNTMSIEAEQYFQQIESMIKRIDDICSEYDKLGLKVDSEYRNDLVNNVSKANDQSTIDSFLKDLSLVLDRYRSTVKSIKMEEVTLSVMPNIKYTETYLSAIKKSEKYIQQVKKQVDASSKKQIISNDEAVILTNYFNKVMPFINRYIKEMTNGATTIINAAKSFCDNAVAVYE